MPRWPNRPSIAFDFVIQTFRPTPWYRYKLESFPPYVLARLSYTYTPRLFCRHAPRVPAAPYASAAPAPGAGSGSGSGSDLGSPWSGGFVLLSSSLIRQFMNSSVMMSPCPASSTRNTSIWSDPRKRRILQTPSSFRFSRSPKWQPSALRTAWIVGEKNGPWRGEGESYTRGRAR